MADETTEVKNKTGDASAQQQDVEKKASGASAEDPEVRLNALLEENKKLTSDRDNYRNALLAKKGKIEAEELDLTDPTQLGAYISKTVEDRLLAERQSRSEGDIEAYARELARKNKELTIALSSRTTVSAAGTGAGSTNDTKDVEVGYFSPEQKEALKKKGFTDEQIKKTEENSKKATGGVV